MNTKNIFKVMSMNPIIRLMTTKYKGYMFEKYYQANEYEIYYKGYMYENYYQGYEYENIIMVMCTKTSTQTKTKANVNFVEVKLIVLFSTHNNFFIFLFPLVPVSEIFTSTKG